MPCPCCGPQTCDCTTLSNGAPFPLPPGKAGILLKLTLIPKDQLSTLAGEITIELPLSHPANGSTAEDYANDGLCYYFNQATGEVDCTFAFREGFDNWITARVRCWRGGGPPKQGQFYFAFAIGGQSLRYGYRENGEWFFNPEQLVGLTSLAGEAWFDPVVEGGNCSISSQAVLRWPQDYPNASFACDDLGICAEARFDLF